ncbi:MAG: DNRLRE domain-containing protein [Oscillospiraceae bacterium]|jgi:hypothetical protein|nr:DNRLRE domain-containing protein [Oscillospiraceae bacterium]
MKKLICICLLLALLLPAAACGAQAPGAAESVPATEPPNATTSAKWALSGFNTFSEERPAEEGGTGDTLQIGETPGGQTVFALLRMDLGAEWLANELTDAALFLKPTGTHAPEQLRVRLLTGGWDIYFTPRSEVEALMAEETVIVPVFAETDGWLRIPLTGQVKTWLAGGLQNNGLALFGNADGALDTFASDEENAPYLLASGVTRERALGYGKFSYKEMRTTGVETPVGNCLSYALRDENVIEGEHLQSNSAEMARVYGEGGLNALADYYARLVANYVEAHKTGLQISGFRQIDSFDAAIDPAKEYRIAMRLGVTDGEDAVDFNDERAFDYHFWTQLSDGQWAQKFPTGDSQIVSCTGPGISPGKFPWHSSYLWTPKSRDYYNSKTVYFAVAKDTDEFTRHREDGSQSNQA